MWKQENELYKERENEAAGFELVVTIHACQRNGLYSGDRWIVFHEVHQKTEQNEFIY